MSHTQVPSENNMNGIEVAIIGMAGRFPGANTVDEFWRNLCEKEESLHWFSEFDTPLEDAESGSVPATFRLSDIDAFDAKFFAMSPREAAITDPQQRLLLECAYQALEQSGYAPQAASRNVGVYVSSGPNAYLTNHLLTNPAIRNTTTAMQLLIGNDKDYAANRISYKLDLKGPSVVVQSACSSSLLAVHMAAQSLLAGECDMALAGGLSLDFPEEEGYRFEPGGILSKDGHCKPFSDQSSGTVRGNGGAVVVLKRLEDALADGDRVYAVIKGSATNNDGADKVGYAAPSVEGQSAVIRTAHAVADVAPASIGYVETHGTGTALGDPIEIAALTEAFGPGLAAEQCRLGAVKSNIGHLDAGAGIAGLIKAVLCVHHGYIPATLHYDRPNPSITFEATPFRVVNRGEPWDETGPRRAGVSSFGIGGSNVHVVLEQAPSVTGARQTEQGTETLILAAKSKASLKAMANNLATYLAEHPESDLAAVAHTLRNRPAYSHRMVVVADSILQATEALTQGTDALKGEATPEPARFALMFPGQGTQFSGMAADLYRAGGLFAEVFDRIAKVANPQLGLDLAQAVFAGTEADLSQTWLSQPALFAVEYALARHWLAQGVEPVGMIGHSIGEYVAACLASVFSLEDAVSLVIARGRLMQSMPGGSMLAVQAAAAELAHRLPDSVSIAAINRPSLTVLSGPDEAIAKWRDRLEEEGLTCHPLHTSHAFHSAMMEPCLDDFAEVVVRVPLHRPTQPFISNLTGTWITPEQATDPAYWVRHLRGTVRFAEGLATLIGDSPHTLLECGPGASLSGAAREVARGLPHVNAVPLLPPATQAGPADRQALRVWAQLWCWGHNTPSVPAGQPGHMLPLPPYAFERSRHWVAPGQRHAGTNALPDAASREREGAADTGRPRLTPETATTPLDRLTALWCEALGLEELDPNEDFFDLGGDSIISIQITNRARGLGLHIRSSDLLEHPTVNRLHKHLGGREADHTEASEPAYDEAQAYLDALETDPEAAHEPFPLTDIQHAYWLGRNAGIQSGHVAAHAYEEFECLDLDVPRLEQALNQVIARHDMLRAVITEEGRQRVLESVPRYELAVNDYSHLTSIDALARLSDYRERKSHQVMPSDQWPLFDLSVSHLPDGTTRLHVSFDLLIMDAWSITLFWSELEERYCNPDYTPDPLPVGFRDYVLAEQRLEQGPTFARARDYWRAKLDTLPGPPALPLACDPESLTQHHFVRRETTIPANLWRRLKAAGSRHGLTPSTVLCMAYSEILATRAENPHFCLNLPAFNRLEVHPRIAEVMGDFTSVLLFEIDLRREEPFAERAKATQKRLWSDLSSLQYSGVRLLRDLAERQAERLTMPYVFTSLIFPQAEDKPIVSRLGKLVDGISQTPHVWLDCQVYEENGNLVINWDAVDALFDPTMLDSLFLDYRALLMQLARTDDYWTSGDWRDHWAERMNTGPILAANQTEAVFPYTRLHEGFLASARARPQDPAVFGEQVLNYAQLDQRSAHAAHRLAGEGIGPGDRVAVVAEKGWEQLVATLAVLRCGAAYVPLAPDLPAERLHRLMEAADIRVALTTPEVDKQLTWPTEAKRLTITAEPVTVPAQWRDPEIDPDSLAYIIFTSGTTGQPKGVMITHRAATNTVSDINQRFGVTADDRVLALSSLSFDLSVYDFFGPLALGAAVVIPRHDLARDPVHWIGLVREHRVTLWNSVPALVELLITQLAADSAELPTLRLVMMSGDWIHIGLPGKIDRYLPSARAISLGGATEAAIWSIFHDIGKPDPALTSIPYGKALANQRFYVLDAHQRLRPVGALGELYIGGQGLALGYLNNPTETEARFITHPRTGERLYRTGDMGRWLPDGSIEFLGRTDNQVKINGFRVETGEIDRAACDHPDVDACLTVAHKAGGAAILVSYLRGPQGPATDTDAVTRWLADRLPGYMVPSVIIPLAEFPLSANGKVDLAKLPRPEPGDANEPLQAPATDTERRLLAMAREILDCDTFSVTRDLFTQGMDSRRLTELVTRIRAGFTRDFPLRAAFEAPTLRDIAQALSNLMEGATPERDATVIQPVPEGQPWPLSSAQLRLWFHDQLYPGNSTYNLVEPFRFHGPLDTERLTTALEDFVARHALLRSVIRDDNAEPTMVEADENPFRVQLTDARSVPRDQRDAHIRAAVNAAAAEPFDMARGPLFKARLIQFAADDTALIIGVHHIVWDGWSTAILIREINEAYQHPAIQPRHPTQTDRLNFAAVARWEQRQLATGAFAQQLDYWKKQLGDDLPTLALPTDGTGTAEPKVAGARHSFRLDGTRSQAFEQGCGRRRLTPFMGYMAAWQVLLHWWSGQNDIVVGTPAGHRANPALTDVVGYLVNSLAIRIRLDPDAPFGDLCDRVRQTCLDAYSHQDIPFDQVVGAVRPKRRLSESAPIYRSWFVLHDVPMPPWKLGDTHADVLDAEFLLDVHDIKLSLVARHGGMEGGMDYRTALFKPDTIARLTRCFVELINALGASMDIGLPALRERLDQCWQEQEADTPAATQTLPSWDFSVSRRR